MENILVSREERKCNVNLKLTWRYDLVLGAGYIDVEDRYCWLFGSLDLSKIEKMNKEEFILIILCFLDSAGTRTIIHSLSWQ